MALEPKGYGGGTVKVERVEGCEDATVYSSNGDPSEGHKRRKMEENS